MTTPSDTPPVTPWDTQKFKTKLLEVAKMIIDSEDDEPKSPPYLLVILLMLLFGLGAVVVLVTVRQDLDFLVVSGGIFLLVTSLTTNIFNIMKTNQIAEAQARATRERRIAAEKLDQATAKLDEVKKEATEAKVQTLATHKIVDGQMDLYKADLKEKEAAKGRLAAEDARREGEDEGEKKAEERAEKKKE